MKSSRKVVIPAVIFFTAVLAACSPSGGAPGTGGKAAEQTEQAVPVAVASPEKGTVQAEAGLTGKLEANESVDVSSKVSGKITSLPVKLGQKVNKGDILFTIDKEELENSVKTAQAQYESAQASLAQTRDSRSDNAAQAENSLVQAKQSLDDAKRNVERLTNMYNQGAISQQELENAKTELVNAQTSYNNAQKNYDSSKKNSSIVVSESSVKQAKTSLDNAMDQLKNATVTAPISGVIGAVNGAVGEMASGQTAIVTVVNTNPMKVKVLFAEAEVSGLQVGGKVTVEIPVLNKTVEGSIYAISPVMDETNRAFPVEIVIPNEENQFKAGMVANVVVEKSTQAQSLVVPKSALLEEEGKYYVYKVEGDVVEKVEITVGNMSSEQAEVTSGLTEKDQVVYKGQTLVEEGNKVKVEK